MFKAPPQVRDFMTMAPQTIGASTLLSEARERMRAVGVRHFPVEKGGEIVGILTDRSAKALSGRGGFTAEDVMIPDPVRVEPHTPLAEVAAIMAEDKYGCVLVESEGELLGIFTTVDACRALRQTLDQLYPQ